MRLLDLFCGVGGAAKGYQRAGFYVVGVDFRSQPRYCGDEFVQGDALTYVADMYIRDGFDAIHASPPCQRYSVTRTAHPREEYPDLLPPTLAALAGIAVPWVVENVPGSPIRGDLMLCGTMFGLRVARHRYFQTNWPVPALGPASCNHTDLLDMYSSGENRRGTERQYCDEMGVTWAPVRLGNRRYAATESIPPAYTEWIGRQLLAALATPPDVGRAR